MATREVVSGESAGPAAAEPTTVARDLLPGNLALGASLAALAPPQRAAYLARLQRTAGNRAVAAAVARQPVPRPMPPMPTPPRPFIVPPSQNPGNDNWRPPPGPGVVPRGPDGDTVPLPGPGPSELPPQTLDEMFEEHHRQNRVRDAMVDEETPRATLERGGSRPDFVTRAGKGAIQAEGETRRVTLFKFHVLDAIEHEVEGAASDDDLQQIVRRYMYERLPGVVFDPDLDPAALKRFEVYSAAVRKRKAAVPSLGTAKAAKVETPDFMRRRGCLMVPAGPLGGDPLADIFCQMVTGAPFEARVTAPDGDWAQYDALLGDMVIECKCGYGSVVRDMESDEAWKKRRAEMRLDKLDEQMRRYSRVASKCGLKFAYMVSNANVAKVLSDRWMNTVPVLHQPWDECG